VVAFRALVGAVLLLVIGVGDVRADPEGLPPFSGRGSKWGEAKVALTIFPTVIGDPLPEECAFVLYSTGRAIYSTPAGRGRAIQHDPIPYFTVTLTPAEQEALLKDLPLDKVGSWPAGIEGDDGSTFCIEVWSRGKRKGSCQWGDVDDHYKAPPDMVKIWKRLSSFESSRATPWKPDAKLH
jgi:hypothetical protein